MRGFAREAPFALECFAKPVQKAVKGRAEIGQFVGGSWRGEAAGQIDRAMRATGATARRQTARAPTNATARTTSVSTASVAASVRNVVRTGSRGTATVSTRAG